MTSEECHLRAAECATNAAMSGDESVTSEFMALAARWRAMAVREIFLGYACDPADEFGRVPAFRAPSNDAGDTTE
jgi:hypothetical protein